MKERRRKKKELVKVPNKLHCTIYMHNYFIEKIHLVPGKSVIIYQYDLLNASML